MTSPLSSAAPACLGAGEHRPTMLAQRARLIAVNVNQMWWTA
ncbi:hypothetical protein [uncultured Tessaracoccus sp.]|nr:hypothetical protein [uncultured Tessaracoccus sp.]